MCCIIFLNTRVDFNDLYNVQLLAYIPIAIVSVSMFSSVNASMFSSETKSLILLDLSEEYIEFVMKEVILLLLQLHNKVLHCEFKLKSLLDFTFCIFCKRFTLSVQTPSIVH